jgi:integrase/recombinase XerD
VSAAVVQFDPLRDKTYQSTRLGRDVADFLAWLELGGASPRTLDQYERDLARGALMFPEKGIAEITDGDMAHIARSFQPLERRTRVAAWKSFFKWAVQTRRIVAKPTDALPTIKRQPKKVYDIFSAADVALLTGLPDRDGTLFEIMFGAGPRKGDCRNLRLRDWRSEATPDAPYGLLVFREGKGGKDRQFPATEPIARKLAELAILDGLKPNDHLWYTRPGGGGKIAREKPIGDGSFDRWWTRCLETAGVRYRNPHLTRHTFATRFLRQRGRLETLQLILGHESIQTTADLYGHLDMRDVAADLGLLQEITPE